MFAKWKEKLAAKKAKKIAIDESSRWKENALLQDCLQAMRGICTMAPMEMHEAAITAANIAIREGSWTALTGIAEDLFDGMVYIVWGEATLPVLRAPWAVAEENLSAIRHVDSDTFLVAESMDKILWFSAPDHISLYNIT